MIGTEDNPVKAGADVCGHPTHAKMCSQHAKLWRSRVGRVSANTTEVDEEKMFGPWKGLSDEERADSFLADIQAAALKNSEIAEELALPPVKIHCSILAEDAIKAAVEDYKKKHATAA